MSWNNVINTIKGSLHQLDDAAMSWSSGTVALSALQQLAKDFAKTESFFLDLALWEKVIAWCEMAINAALLLVSKIKVLLSIADVE